MFGLFEKKKSSKVAITVVDKRYENIFTKVMWSGGINGTARKLEVEYITNSENPVEFKIGEEIQFSYDFEILFLGRIFYIDKKSEDKKSFIAYDDSIYLNKNYFVKNFFKKKPSEIVYEICGELQLNVGELPPDEVECTFPAINRNGYEIILNAYRIQHDKTKDIYSIVCNSEGDIVIVDQGNNYSDVIIHSTDVIENSTFSQDISNMINQIVIYKTENEKQQIIDKVANEEDKKKYGIFQRVLEHEKDRDSIKYAKEMLKGVESTARIKCIGNTLIQSGYTIGVMEPHTELVGLFLVKTDVHVFEGETHRCEIELAFENVMDKVEFKNKEKKKKGKEKIYSLKEGEDYVRK